MLRFSVLRKSNLTLLVVGLLTLALSACGDSTPTTPAQSAATVIVSTTAPVTTLAATTIAPTTLTLATATPVPATPTLTSVPTTSAIEAGLTVRANVTPTTTSPVELLLTFKSDANPLTNPFGIALDGQGNLYAVDQDHNQIYKFDKNAQFVTRWGSKGTQDGQFEFNPPAGVDGPGTGFLTIDKAGNLYVSDAYNGRIQKFDSNGKFLAKWSLPPQEPGSPGPLFIDDQNQLYVSAGKGYLKYDSNGQFLEEWDKATLQGVKAGPLFGFGTIDKQHNIYFADLIMGFVYKVSPDKKVLTTFGTKKGQGDGDLDFPVGVATDSKGRVFITDNTSRVQVFDSNGKFLTKWNSPEQPPFDAAAVAVDNQDNIYVSYCDCGGAKRTPAVYKFRLK